MDDIATGQNSETTQVGTVTAVPTPPSPVSGAGFEPATTQLVAEIKVFREGLQETLHVQ